MTIKEKMIKIIDIILDERIMYKDDEVLSLPVMRFKQESIYADEFCRIMERLTFEGCLFSVEDFDICNFDPDYIYHMNFAMVKPNYVKLSEYRNRLLKNEKKIEMKDFTTGNHKIYIDEIFFTDIKRSKKGIILIYFAERYARSVSHIKIEDLLVWCEKRYPEIYALAKNNQQGEVKWCRNGIDDINDDFKRQRKNCPILIVHNKSTGTYEITKPIILKNLAG